MSSKSREIEGQQAGAGAGDPGSDLRWPTYGAGRGITLEEAVFEAERSSALRLRDSEGRVYLDAVAGIGCAVLGHGHRRWVDAISTQLSKLASASNTFTTGPQQRLAAALAERFPIDDCRSFFANTGTEATEAGLKLALRATGRDVVVTCERAFHGRTIGSIALTANPKYREPYVRCMGEEASGRFATMNVVRVPFDDLAALEGVFAELGSRIAAFFVEPIQGEGGVWPASKAYLVGARELCDRHGALLGADEIQCGFGRTGDWSAWETIVGRDGPRPDILWLAKAMGGGFPIGACLTRAELAEHMGPGTHGTTFGGNPAACAAALATIEVIETEGLLAAARAQLPTLQRLAEAEPCAEVTDVRGLGAMIGVQLGELDAGRAAAITPALAAAGLLATTPGGHTVRLLLPYVAGEAELLEAWRAIATACAQTPR